MNGFLDKEKPGLAEENLQARIRGNILMVIANKIGGLVLNTGNKTETVFVLTNLNKSYDLDLFIGVRGSPERGDFVPACVWSGRQPEFELFVCLARAIFGTLAEK